MWVILSEILVFGIMLSLVIGHFGSIGLGANQSVKFKSQVDALVQKIDKISKENTGYKYIVKRNVSSKKAFYMDYSVFIKDSSGDILTGDKLKKYLVDNKIFSGDNNQDNTNSYSKIDLSSYKNLIPAYWWSHTLNNKLANLNPKSTIVIVNPNNGIFSKTEDIFKEEIDKTHKSNNLAIGYMYVNYSKKDLTSVKQNIDNWLKYYSNINGFFIDGSSTESSKLDYYKQIYNYIKSKNSNLVVVLNPGTTPDPSYFNVADNIVVYEDPCNNYNSYSLPDWLKNKNKQISFLGYSCTQDKYNNLENKYGNKYITYFTDDGADGNPWDSLSKYFIK